MTRNRLFATGTAVSAARTRNDIESLVLAHGATAFGYAAIHAKASVTFHLADREIRVEIPLPTIDDEVIRYTSRGSVRPEGVRRTVLEQTVRQRWRALLLIIRAKLEAIESGISTVDGAFFADVVLDNGLRVEEWARPQLSQLAPGSHRPLLLEAPA